MLGPDGEPDDDGFEVSNDERTANQVLTSALSYSGRVIRAVPMSMWVNLSYQAARYAALNGRQLDWRIHLALSAAMLAYRARQRLV